MNEELRVEPWRVALGVLALSGVAPMAAGCLLASLPTWAVVPMFAAIVVVVWRAIGGEAK